MFSLQRISSSIGNAIAFSGMVAMVTSVTFIGSLMTLAVLFYPEMRSPSIFINLAVLVAGVPIIGVLGSVFCFVPIFLGSFLVCASRPLSKLAFIAATSAIGTISILVTVYAMFWRNTGIPARGEPVILTILSLALAISVAAFVQMSLRLVWNPRETVPSRVAD
jgi:hypothetical protein